MKKQVVVVVLICVMVIALAGCGNSNYEKAMSLYSEGKFEEAEKLFAELADYENSADMVLACRYGVANAMYQAGDYEKAKISFKELEDYKDSATMVLECDYNFGKELLKNGDYDGALAIYESIIDYKDSKAMIETVKKEEMYDLYYYTIKALEKNEWYFAGDMDTAVKQICFSNTVATISQIYFDGLGAHDNGSYELPYIIDDENITLILEDDSKLVIPYLFDGNKVALDSKMYFTLDEIEKELQGYWKLRTNLLINCKCEYNVLIDNGRAVLEYANEGIDLPKGEYYYSAPREATYTLTFREIETNPWYDLLHYHFGIIDGEIVLIIDGEISTRSNGFPGENGYNFE